MSTRINQEAFLLGLTGTGNTRLNQLAIMLLTPVSLFANQVQIVGGPFQDAIGDPLSNGYLEMQLQHDAVALNTAQVLGNIAVRIPLDINGFIQGTVTGAPIFIWPNTNLLPAGGSYLVWAYDSANRQVWDNPQVQQVTASNPFNVNAWVPGP